MPIARLSDDTTRVLRSTVVLNDASAIIKELIDNALDSKATTISIEISANALDVIQVKDNGTGIGVEDRQLLCKRGCTSKIRTLHDLENLGGHYLGFRGEALSSIADISDNVIITTRVEDEIVGTSLKFGPKGKLQSSASSSHPVGTTVKVQKFLSRIPVRKQTASKQSHKVLTNVRRLLYAYAFVRPMVRFSLKVLKHDNDKVNWSFAPDDVPGQLLNTATKIVGKEVAALCRTHATTISSTNGASYSANALLLTPNTSGVKIGNWGQFLAIDGRPVNADRGTMKKISRLYRQYLQASSDAGSSIPASPFLVLQITCPQGSYDVNIEPAKDEVFFHDADTLLELGEQLFTEAYGERPMVNSATSRVNSDATAAAVPALNILLARRKPSRDDADATVQRHDGSTTRNDSDSERSDSSGIPEPNHGSEESPAMAELPSSAPERHQSLSNMYDIDDDEVGMTNREIGPGVVRELDFENDDEHAAMSCVRNPFTTAALHARLQPRNMTDLVQSSSARVTADGSDEMANGIMHSSARMVLGTSTDMPYLPTPSKSPTRDQPYQNSGPPIPRHSKVIHSDEESENEEVGSSAAASIRPQQQLLQNWIQSSGPSQASNPTAVSTTSSRDESTVPKHIVFRNDGLSRIPVISATVSQQPFKSPVKRTTQSSPSRHVDPKRRNLSTSDLTELSELDQIMDFEHRKRAVIQQSKLTQPRLNPADLALLQRQSLESGSQATSSLNSRDTAHDSDRLPGISYQILQDSIASQHPNKLTNPHQNRYQAAIRDLTSRDQHAASYVPDINDVVDTNDADDQQLAPIHHPLAWPRSMKEPSQQATQHSARRDEPDKYPASRTKRPKTLRPALEHIPVEAMKYNVACIPAHPFPELNSLTEELKLLAQHDRYIKSGTIETIQWTPFSPSIQKWQSSLEKLMNESYRPNHALDISNSSSSSTTTSSSLREQEKTSSSETTKLESNKLHFKINLVQAFKSHLLMLSDLEQTDLNTELH